MRLARSTRPLKGKETDLAKAVFDIDMPKWGQIGITDGLGMDDTVWTHTRSMVPLLPSQTTFQYFINFGDAAALDLSVPKINLGHYVPGYPLDDVDNVFIHEMTHVWQYSRCGASAARIAARCVYAQRIGAGYEFKPGDPWNNYNLEQQAHIVEVWNSRNRLETDELFPYIYYIIRSSGRKNYNYSDTWWGSEADLSQLQALLDIERMPVKDSGGGAVQVTAKDDSFIIVLKGDLLFDVDKFNLKPTAESALQQAQTVIKSNARLRTVYFNGHTDSSGDDGHNLQLSSQRAQSVAQWFTSRGYLAPTAVKTQGFGKSQPVAPNSTAEGRAKNRRVEIYLANN